MKENKKIVAVVIMFGVDFTQFDSPNLNEEEEVKKMIKENITDKIHPHFHLSSWRFFDQHYDEPKENKRNWFKNLLGFK
jgi:hypothetical protein